MCLDIWKSTKWYWRGTGLIEPQHNSFWRHVAKWNKLVEPHHLVFLPMLDMLTYHKTARWHLHTSAIKPPENKQITHPCSWPNPTEVKGPRMWFAPWTASMVHGLQRWFLTQRFTRSSMPLCRPMAAFRSIEICTWKWNLRGVFFGGCLRCHLGLQAKKVNTKWLTKLEDFTGIFEGLVDGNFKRLLPLPWLRNGCKAVCLFDCCHSATVANLTETMVVPWQQRSYMEICWTTSWVNFNVWGMFEIQCVVGFG